MALDLSCAFAHFNVATSTRESLRTLVISERGSTIRRRFIRTFGCNYVAPRSARSHIGLGPGVLISEPAPSDGQCGGDCEAWFRSSVTCPA